MILRKNIDSIPSCLNILLIYSKYDIVKLEYLFAKSAETFWIRYV